MAAKDIISLTLLIELTLENDIYFYMGNRRLIIKEPTFILLFSKSGLFLDWKTSTVLKSLLLKPCKYRKQLKLQSGVSAMLLK